MLRRTIHAALLHPDTYEEVEADRSATLEAGTIVFLVALATGIGSISNSGPGGVVWGTLWALVGWYIWAWVAMFIGTRWLPTRETVSDHGELLRTVGFSTGPGMLRVLAIFPPIAGPVFLLATLWMLVAMVVAVRQALDYQSTWRAVAVVAIGFPIYAAILAVSLLLMGPWPV